MEEMETGSEVTQSEESTGAATDASASESDGGEVAQAASPKQESEIDWSKAFEHPRFKELIGQKNEAQAQYQDMASKHKALEQQLHSLRESQPKAPTETDALLADLKKIDPRLANLLESNMKAAETAKSVQEKLEAFERSSQESAQKQTMSTAVSRINSLHESGKTSEFGKKFIESQLDLAYRNGKLNISDLKAVDSAYAEASKAIKAFEDSFKRDVTKGYVQDKTKDASIPASVPKGAPAKAAPKSPGIPKDREALKAAVVKSYMKEQAASKEASNT